MLRKDNKQLGVEVVLIRLVTSRSNSGGTKLGTTIVFTKYRTP